MDNLNTPEPVPATNQAGEVERKARLAHAKAWLCKRWSQEHPNAQHIIQLADYAAALATQPATSQEGEEWKPDSETIRGCIGLISQFGHLDPETSDQDAENKLIVKCITRLRTFITDEPEATPTPPTLSEDLRAALGRVVRSDQVRDWRAKCDNPTSTSDWVWRDGRYVIIDWPALAQVKAS